MKWLVQSFFIGLAIVTTISPGVSAQDGFGGARNNGNIRDQVTAGFVPSPDAFAVEGMLAEHHFPVRSERCGADFCVLAAMGHGIHRPSQTRSAYLFVEPVSGLDPEGVKRAPQNLALVIDRSGSMTGWKMSSVLEAAHVLVDQLDERDRLAVIAFDTEAELLRPALPVGTRRALHDLIDRISAGGTTNIHAAMKMGFSQVAKHVRAGRGSRVIVMTDERPNVGETSKGGFLELIGSYARRGVATSILGVGLDLGTHLAFSMSQLRGGSYHYLENETEVEELFVHNLASFLTPTAYDIVIRVRPAPGLRVAEVFGVPADQVVLKKDGSAVLRAATVFFDKKRSGAILRLEPLADTPHAALDAAAELSWSYVFARDGGVRSDSRRVTHRAARPDALAEFENAYHYRGYALANFAELLKRSLSLWHGDQHHRAVNTLRLARAALDLDAWVTNDSELCKERQLADDLLRTMTASPRRFSYPG